MITLCMDSAHKCLTIALLKDDEILASVSKEAWKKQSELIFLELTRLMSEAHLQSEDIDQVVITDGPGSYTGVRIAMTIAKVFCTGMHKPLYTVSALQLYAGDCPNAFVMMDARGKRAYTASIIDGKVKEKILFLDEIPARIKETQRLFGDTALIGKQAEPSDFIKNFIALKDQWKLVKNVHALTPRYLKDRSAYKL